MNRIPLVVAALVFCTNLLARVEDGQAQADEYLVTVTYIAYESKEKIAVELTPGDSAFDANLKRLEKRATKTRCESLKLRAKPNVEDVALLKRDGFSAKLSGTVSMSEEHKPLLKFAIAIDDGDFGQRGELRELRPGKEFCFMANSAAWPDRAKYLQTLVLVRFEEAVSADDG